MAASIGNGPGGAIPPGLRGIPDSPGLPGLVVPQMARFEPPADLPMPSILAGATTPVPAQVSASVTGSFGTANELAFTAFNATILFKLSNVEREAAKQACLNGWTAGIQGAESTLREELKKANAEPDPVKRAAKREEAKANYREALEANDEAYAINKAYYGTKT